MSDFKAKMHQNPKFGRGCAPCPAGGAYSAPPDLLAGFKGPTSKGREGRGVEGIGGERRGGMGKEEGMGWEGSVVESKKSLK